MTEQTKDFAGSPSAPGVQFRPHYSQDTFWSPLRTWWQNHSPGRLLTNQEFGMSPLLEVGDLRDFGWMDNTQRRLAASSWPGYISSKVASASPTSELQSGPRLSRAESAGLQGVSEVREDRYKWRISLDVSHFSPAEITLRTHAGFLEIQGEHGERPDEQGCVSRCFTRKYTLPVSIDLLTIHSSLYGDGILSVEASLSDPRNPADINIPIQVEKETLKVEVEDGGDMAEDTIEAHSSEAVPETQEDMDERTHTKPDGETEGQASGSAGGEAREEGLPSPTEPFEDLETSSSPDTVPADQGEEQAHDLSAELQHPEVTGEKMEDLPQSEESEPGISAPEVGAGSKKLEVPEQTDMEELEHVK
ncbi:hypothetical protein DPEC_G00256950 [Dallia pectoralis]|uniref:Uncharacterized protein n=1 Tax=Dallia pectoralis TaxID=75939 RepID=A0ACC2FQK7_DALPE|nr:hypothetical protein DPEC_G00256950 [Dallia pectoralis]